MNKEGTKSKILIGNSFPFGLVRCAKLTVESVSLAELRASLVESEVVSFWGHSNTRISAEAILGVSLLPKTERPAITLTAEGLPMLEGEVFDTCWLLSPDYEQGFRPAIGVEVGLEQITGWHILKLTWESPTAMDQGYEKELYYE
jgi:hypothetical protein